MAIDKGVLDQLLAGRDPQELFATGGLLDELKKALSERMLWAELDDHLESESAEGAINRRNGTSRKTVLTEASKLTLDIPRDRAGTFDPERKIDQTDGHLRCSHRAMIRPDIHQEGQEPRAPGPLWIDRPVLHVPENLSS